jgi:hypothetical protein
VGTRLEWPLTARDPRTKKTRAEAGEANARGPHAGDRAEDFRATLREDGRSFFKRSSEEIVRVRRVIVPGGATSFDCIVAPSVSVVGVLAWCAALSRLPVLTR